MNDSLNRCFARIVAGLVLATGVGCASSTPSPAVSAIAISPVPCIALRTQSTQLSAKATMPDGTQEDVTSNLGIQWTSANPQTLTVNSVGVAVGVNPGATGVRAAYRGATGETTCTVSP
jgi:hypothetical protein